MHKTYSFILYIHEFIHITSLIFINNFNKYFFINKYEFHVFALKSYYFVRFILIIIWKQFSHRIIIIFSHLPIQCFCPSCTLFQTWCSQIMITISWLSNIETFTIPFIILDWYSNCHSCCINSDNTGICCFFCSYPYVELISTFSFVSHPVQY